MSTVSKVSPIHFKNLHSPVSGKTLQELSCCDQDWQQCFLSSDTLRFQAFADSLLTTLSVNINGDIIPAFYTVDTRHDFLIDLSDYRGQTITVEIGSVVGPDFVAEDTTDPIYIIDTTSDCQPCSVFIEYGADCEIMGVEYDNNFTSHGIRVKAVYFRPSQSVTERNISKQSNGTWEMCSSELDEAYELTLQAAPYWLFQLMEKIGQHPTISIEGREFVLNTPFALGQAFQGGALRRATATFLPKLNEYDVKTCCV